MAKDPTSDAVKVQGVPQHDEAGETDENSVPRLDENTPSDYMDKVAHYVDQNNLSKSEELRYYKKCARRVRCIMAGIRRQDRREWQDVLNTLQYLR
tara:strand:- start:325 stop:612 length:288 start_codon:yes stop_codon:yes gene_type:complete